MTALRTAWPEGRGAHTRPGSATCTRSQVPFDGSTDVGALAREYLGPDEQAAFEAKTGRGRVQWLLGRVAAKDAVQRHLLSRDFALIDPTRIVLDNDARGCPRVRVRGAGLATRGVQVSIAHKPALAVAVAAIVRTPTVSPDTGRIGIGIDVEAVEPRSPSFERMVLTPAERTLPPAADDARDAWLTRLWTVKEAVAKATGLGLGGRPKDFEIDAVLGARLRCRGRWIATEPLDTARGHFMVAWTDSY